METLYDEIAELKALPESRVVYERKCNVFFRSSAADVTSRKEGE